MRHVVLVAGLILGAGAALADPVEGVWKTQPDDNGKYGNVQIAACGAAFCGTLIAAMNADGTTYQSDNIGKQILWDMAPDGAGYYSGGQVWAPDRDKTYSGHMTLSGDTLSLAGCIMGGLLCRSQEWTRVK